MRRLIATLATLFSIAHLIQLPPTLEDIDSVNFALGVRDFDVARHQPHPPGYPVFIALGKAGAGVLQAVGVADPVPRALAALSALSGALCVPLLFAVYFRLAGDVRLAWWAMAVAVCSPLLWFTAFRPLSDTTGLAFTLATQVFLLAALPPWRKQPPTIDGAPRAAGPIASPTAKSSRGSGTYLIIGGLLAGVATGVRVQTAMLTGPLLAAALVWPGNPVGVVHRLGAVAAAAGGLLAWGVPLVLATGGLSEYLKALGSQAGEDFSGVVMLWTTRTPRVAVDALSYSFAWPWGMLVLGVAVALLAVVGAVRALWRAPRTLVLLAIAFGPYAIFHVLFHETATIRYALPLVVPVAFLAMYAIATLGGGAVPVTGALLAGAMLIVTAPAARAFARDGSPAFHAFRAAVESPEPDASDGWDGRLLGMHAGMRRVEEWETGRHRARVLRAPQGREWLTLVASWRNEPESVIRFLADPRRTDLALFDPRARRLDLAARWTFPEAPFVGGTRPGATDVYTMRPPGWMLETGWALTAEIGGVTARDGLGPHVQPSVAWIHARQADALLVIGGRNLGSREDAPARVTLATVDGAIDSFDAPPGFFFRQVTFPPGALDGAGYVPLRVSAVAGDASGRPVPVSLEQFDLQSSGIPMFGFVDGWGEPEYNPRTGRAWRWMSERARLWLRPTGSDVTLTMSGESPMRYFDRAPDVRVSVAGQEVTRFSPSADFEHTVRILGPLLQQSDGQVLLESSLWFSPSQQGGDDPRHLALRIYSMTVADARR